MANSEYFKKKKQIDESELHKKLMEDAAQNREAEERKKKAYLNQTRYEGLKEAGVKKTAKDEKISAEQWAKLDRWTKEGRNTQNMQVGTYFSWIMDGEPQCKALIKFLVHGSKAKLRPYISFGVQNVLAPVGYGLTDAAKYSYKYMSGKLKEETGIELPDLKYIAELDENGKLNLNFMRECFGDLLNDENGEFSDQKLQVYYNTLNIYFLQWLDSLDGLNNEKGYFIDNNKVYRKEHGDYANDKWKVKPDFVYEALNQEQFKEVLQGCGYPEKSFATFLKNKVPDLDLRQHHTPAPKP